MEVLLVGAETDRARVRAILPDNVHVAAEASTLDDARADDHDVDAWVFAPARRRRIHDGAAIESLTARERQVLELLADGFPNKQIAGASICGKLGVSNRTEAVRRALRRGLLSI